MSSQTAETSSSERPHSATANTRSVAITYNDWITRWFVAASVGWGIVALLVGVVIAVQLAWHPANLGPYLSFGRLRPLHTNAAIFAFVGNMMFAGVYYSTQRLVKARLGSDFLSKFHFFGWQLIIVAAAITLPLGITQGKEYAELEWPIDIAIAVVWVGFAINFFWTLAKRAEKQLYVAVWFYIATIVTVAVLHIVNSLAIPVSLFKSYSIFGGAQDALVQWWYGHNAVAFFLTTPILGIMYYFLPKAAERPVFSYRLSIIHFWALVFMYIWAGPHHLLNTALPEWAQTLGMVFSVMLWAPSWGGMLNGLLTLRGAWNKVRQDPVLKFFAAGVTFYGMATFEGPLLSIRSVSGLAHYTDWIIGHVHGGALGWNGLMAAGMFYWLVPRLYGTTLHSKRAANLHFYLATVGIIMYMVAMWVGGITQGMMWRATDEKGSLLYLNFIDTLVKIKPMYWFRIVGGVLYLVGMIMMAWNLWVTARKGSPTTVTVQVLQDAPVVEETWKEVAFGKPVILTVVTLVAFAGMAFTNDVGVGAFLLLGLLIGGGGLFVLTLGYDKSKPRWHALLEGRSLLLTVFTVIAVLIGGVVEIIPTLMVKAADKVGTTAQQPYTPLELEGRDIYLKEGCYNCHSQMIRPFVWEAERYKGGISRLEDSRYDHPFQWGSKRTGPDLARVGIKYSPEWHYRHMINPRDIEAQSNMPTYAHLATTPADYSKTADKLRAMRAVGVPYTPEQIARAEADAKAQADQIIVGLRAKGIDVGAPNDLVSLVAFLQRLGKAPYTASPAPVAPMAAATTDKRP